MVEENAAKKKKQKKPRVIHALGNIKWGFVNSSVSRHLPRFPTSKLVSADESGRGGDPADKVGSGARHQAQRERHLWIERKKTIPTKNYSLNSMCQESLDEFRLLSRIVPWAAVIR